MSFNTGNPVLEAFLMKLDERIRALEIGQACRDPRIAHFVGINTPIIDGFGNAGKLSDVFVLGGTALGAHKKHILRIRDEIEIQDKRGRAGVEKHVVLDEDLEGYATPAFI